MKPLKDVQICMLTVNTSTDVCEVSVHKQRMGICDAEHEESQMNACINNFFLLLLIFFPPLSLCVSFKRLHPFCNTSSDHPHNAVKPNPICSVHFFIPLKLHPTHVLPCPLPFVPAAPAAAASSLLRPTPELPQ